MEKACKEPNCQNRSLPSRDYCLDHMGNNVPTLRFNNHAEVLSRMIRVLGDGHDTGNMLWNVQVMKEEYEKLSDTVLELCRDRDLTRKPEIDMDEFNDGDMKLRINNFLWSNLPGDITIDEAEKVSLGVLDLMKGAYEDVRRRREVERPVLVAEHRQENSGRFA